MTETAYRLSKERGIMCECCGSRIGVEAHHCLYHRCKDIKELNADENLALVCLDCHKITGKANSWEFKQRFWQIQCKRYGKDHMINWHNSLPMKVKERYE